MKQQLLAIALCVIGGYTNAQLVTQLIAADTTSRTEWILHGGVKAGQIRHFDDGTSAVRVFTGYELPGLKTTQRTYSEIEYGDWQTSGAKWVRFGTRKIYNPWDRIWSEPRGGITQLRDWGSTKPPE